MKTDSSHEESWLLISLVSGELRSGDMDRISKQLGRCLMISQMLEYVLSCLMLVVNDDIDPFHDQGKLKILDYSETLRKSTMGSLFFKLNKIATVDAGAQEMFEKALDARNYIAHQFLKDHTDQLLTKKGRAKTLSVLMEKQTILHECYNQVLPMIPQVMKFKGIDSSHVFQPVHFEH